MDKKRNKNTYKHLLIGGSKVILATFNWRIYMFFGEFSGNASFMVMSLLCWDLSTLFVVFQYF